jgi:Domain of unknown function (DUF4383)
MDRNRTLAQNLALLLGVVFLVVGILGFIPGITTNYDDLSFAGKDSDAELLGIFQVSVLHNIAHLLFGVGILLARTHEGARTYLLGGSIIYPALFIYGLFVGGDDDANFIPMNGADDVLHLALAILFIGAYFVTGREQAPAPLAP